MNKTIEVTATVSCICEFNLEEGGIRGIASHNGLLYVATVNRVFVLNTEESVGNKLQKQSPMEEQP